MGSGGVQRQYWCRRSGVYRGNAYLTLYGLVFLLYAILRTRNLPPRANPPVFKRPDGLKTVMVIFGTRPEAVKMAPVIQELAKSAELRSYIVSTGQHKQMLEQVLTEFGLSDKVHENLALMRPGQRLAALSSAAIEAIDVVVSRVRPDMVLVQGDTTTAFIAALVSFYEKIPVGHIEAGLRTHDIYSPFPEEINRQSISNIASLHFAPTELSANNLKAEGKIKNVFVTGNTVVDALRAVLQKSDSKTLADYRERLRMRSKTDDTKMILLTAHRRENFGEPLQQIFSAVDTLLREHHDIVIMYPIHLNPEVSKAAKAWFGEKSFKSIQKGHRTSLSERSHIDRLLIVPPVEHTDLVALIQTSYFVLTDSGGIQEEAITLGKPVLVLRNTTERPEGVQAGASRLIGHSRDTIVRAVRELLTQKEVYLNMSNSRQLFGDGYSAEKIVEIIENFFRLREVSD